MWEKDQILYEHIDWYNKHYSNYTIRVIKDANGGGTELSWLCASVNNLKHSYASMNLHLMTFDTRTPEMELKYKCAFDRVVLVIKKLYGQVAPKKMGIPINRSFKDCVGRNITANF